jgi:RNA polymerase sigma-70 factor (ECF subfamily)
VDFGAAVNRLELIIQKYSRDLYAYCFSILINREAAEDVCQDLFVKLLSKPELLNSTRNTRAWLLTAARNRCIDVLRSEQRISSCDRVEEIPAESHSDPQLAILDDELATAVRHALSRLKREHREVLVLRDFNGMSYRHIASHLNWDVEKVRWTLHQARVRLRDFMGDVYE